MSPSVTHDDDSRQQSQHEVYLKKLVDLYQSMNRHAIVEGKIAILKRSIDEGVDLGTSWYNVFNPEKLLKNFLFDGSMDKLETNFNMMKKRKLMFEGVLSVHESEMIAKKDELKELVESRTYNDAVNSLNRMIAYVKSTVANTNEKMFFAAKFARTKNDMLDFGWRSLIDDMFTTKTVIMVKDQVKTSRTYNDIVDNREIITGNRDGTEGLMVGEHLEQDLTAEDINMVFDSLNVPEVKQPHEFSCKSKGPSNLQTKSNDIMNYQAQIQDFQNECLDLPMTKADRRQTDAFVGFSLKTYPKNKPVNNSSMKCPVKSMRNPSGLRSSDNSLMNGHRTKDKYATSASLQDNPPLKEIPSLMDIKLPVDLDGSMMGF